MSTQIRGVLTLTLGVVLAACGTAESAEEPYGTDPVVEAAAPDDIDTTEPTATSLERPAVRSPAPAPSAAPARRSASRSSGPALNAPEAGPPPADVPVVEAPPPFLAAGTLIVLTVDQALSTDHNVAGDAFTATVLHDMLAPDGEVLIAAGSSVHGAVRESLESPSSEEPPTLTLEVFSVQTAAGELPLVADVEDVEMSVENRDSDRSTAGKVAAGAAVGAIVGKITGNKTSSTVKGAVVGAAAGGVVAAATKGGHATVPEGARMIIRLGQALVVR